MSGISSRSTALSISGMFDAETRASGSAAARRAVRRNTLGRIISHMRKRRPNGMRRPAALPGSGGMLSG
jgi:hypothetical protein